MMLRNDRKLGVRNGNRGSRPRRRPRASARCESGSPAATSTCRRRYVDAGHVGLAYAMTVNKAHGTTCDATMMLGDDLLYRELAYEAMSRGRKENRIYMSPHDDDRARPPARGRPTRPHRRPPTTRSTILAAGLERRRNKHLALDSIATVPLDGVEHRRPDRRTHRVRSVLDQAPPDRSADLAALGGVPPRGRAEARRARGVRRRGWSVASDRGGNAVCPTSS